MLPFRPSTVGNAESSDATSQAAAPQKPGVDSVQIASETPTLQPEQDVVDHISVPLPLPDQGTPSPPGNFATYQPPTIPPSEAAPSSGGKTLSCPSEYASLEAPRRVNETSLLSSLFDRGTYDSTIRLRPLELPPISEESSEGYISGLFPWKFEFSWQSEELLFAKERLSIGQRTGPLTNASGAVVGGCSAASITRYTRQESILSLGTMDSQDLLKAIYLEEETAFVISERREYFIRLLEDHYWRAHPPQRSDKRNSHQGRHSGIGTSSRPTSQHAASTSQSFRKLESSKGKGISDGSASDEEDEQGDGTPSSHATGPKEGTQYFACPFLKRDPRRNRRGCMQQFSNITLMIGHLEEKHYFLRCPKCNGTFDSRYKMKKHQSKVCIAPRDIASRPGIATITNEQWAVIKMRPGRYHGPEQRWHSIFKTLFPGSAPPESVYFEGEDNEIMVGLRSVIATCCLGELSRLQEERAREGHLAYAHESPADQAAAIIEELIPRLTDRITSWYKTQDEESSYDPQHIQGPNSRSQPSTALSNQCGPHVPAQQSTTSEPANFKRLQVIPEEPFESTTPTTSEVGLHPNPLKNGVVEQLSPEFPWNETSTDCFGPYMGYGQPLILSEKSTEALKLIPDAQNDSHSLAHNAALNYTQFSTYDDHPSLANLTLPEELLDGLDSYMPLFDVQDTSSAEGLTTNRAASEHLFDMDMPVAWSNNDGLEYLDFSNINYSSEI